eukprot:CAMPEP_0168572328 /NCGR_PEP_ID=MMETSP0413-20121227/17879_1 /TAXON_ID=136452 /ORGANISM="Filamoeba nolandi, Strain NC-AS-23-1" /LENGTH=340 /DNA_ID=CAMNT_0008605377 /DNA_START=260 /DNA_END=1280 /DNA_ORIENTATION=-
MALIYNPHDSNIEDNLHRLNDLITLTRMCKKNYREAVKRGHQDARMALAQFYNTWGDWHIANDMMQNTTTSQKFSRKLSVYDALLKVYQQRYVPSSPISEILETKFPIAEYNSIQQILQHNSESLEKEMLQQLQARERKLRQKFIPFLTKHTTSGVKVLLNSSIGHIYATLGNWQQAMIYYEICLRACPLAEFLYHHAVYAFVMAKPIDKTIKLKPIDKTIKQHNDELRKKCQQNPFLNAFAFRLLEHLEGDAALPEKIAGNNTRVPYATNLLWVLPEDLSTVLRLASYLQNCSEEEIWLCCSGPDSVRRLICGFVQIYAGKINKALQYFSLVENKKEFP